MLGSNPSAAWPSEAARRGLMAPPAFCLCSFGLQSDKSQGVWGTASPKGTKSSPPAGFASTDRTQLPFFVLALHVHFPS